MSIKVTSSPKNKQPTIEMRDMEPLQVGVIVEPGNSHHGETVMRTASTSQFEVMTLHPEAGPRKCWTPDLGRGPTLPVRLLPPGEKVIVEVSNP